MVSIRIASCNSPRPSTRKASVVPVSSTRKETLVSNSFSRRARRSRDVTYCPSRPAKGEELGNFCRLNLPIQLDDAYFRAAHQSSAKNARDGHAPKKVAVIQVG